MAKILPKPKGPTSYGINAEILLSETDGQNNPEPMLRIPLLRKASFKAGKYGNLKFDDAFIQSLITNFRNNVVGVDLSMDVAHQPDLGAQAWFEDIIYEDGKLIVLARPTPEGAAHVRNRKFRYASAEISTNYQDRETGKFYGPTILGAAMTNRPYVHNQGEITMLSLDDGMRVLDGADLEVEGTTLNLGWADALKKTAAKARVLAAVASIERTGSVVRPIRESIKGAQIQRAVNTDFVRQNSKAINRAVTASRKAMAPIRVENAVNNIERTGAVVRTIRSSIFKQQTQRDANIRSTRNQVSAVQRAIESSRVKFKAGGDPSPSQPGGNLRTASIRAANTVRQAVSTAAGTRDPNLPKRQLGPTIQLPSATTRHAQVTPINEAAVRAIAKSKSNTQNAQRMLRAINGAK